MIEDADPLPDPAPASTASADPMPNPEPAPTASADPVPDLPTAGAPGDAITVDARNLRCPMPVIRLAKAAKTAPPGTIVTVLSTDPAAEPDLAAWCRMRGATLLTQRWLDDGTLRTQVQLRPPPPCNRA